MPTNMNQGKAVPVYKWYEKAKMRGAVATDRFTFVEEDGSIRPIQRHIGIDITYPPGVEYTEVMEDMKNVGELKSGHPVVEINVRLPALCF